MDNSDITVKILRSIRDEIRSTNERLDTTNERLGSLEKRQTESEVRLSTELLAVVTAVNEVHDLLKDELAIRKQVTEHEKRILILEQRLGA